MASSYIPSSSGWSSQKYLPQSSGYSSHADAGRMRVVVDRSYDINTNKSTLTFRLQFYSEDYSGTFRARQGGTLKVNGSTIETFEQGSTSSTHFVVTDKDDTWRYMTEGTQTTATWSKTLEHDSDGKLTVTFATDFYIYYTVSGTSYVMRWANSGSITFTEPRMSDVSASNGYFGNAIPISVTRKNNSFTHTVVVTCLGRTETVATKVTTASLSWTPAVATYAPLLTGGMSTSATVTCTTYNGSTSVGTKSVTITLSLKAADVAPSLALTIIDATTAPGQTVSCLDYYGAFVATKSKYKITTNPTLEYGASVAATEIIANGSTYNTSPATTNVIASASQNTIIGRITDSRSQAASVSRTVSVLSYSPPQINSMSVHRCLQDGTDDDTGGYCKVSYNVNISALNNHNCKDGSDNFRANTMSVGIKRMSGSGWIDRDANLDAYSKTSYFIVEADTDYSYNIRLTLSDDFNSTVVIMNLASAQVRPLNFKSGGWGIGIGKVSEYDKTVDLAADWTLLKNGQPVPLSEFYNDSGFTTPDAVYPVGSIFMSVNSTSPASLFGGTWERIQDRFLLAAGSTYAAGGTGGSATMAHTHTMSHTHNLGDHGFAKLTAWSSDNNRVTYKEIKNVTSWTSTYRFSSSGTASYEKASTYGVGLGGRTEGSSAANTGAASNTDNMPPYLTVYVWKRTA